MKKRRPLFLPLILVVMLLLGLSAQAAEVTEPLNVEMSKVGSTDFVYDGSALDSSRTIYHKFTLKKPSRIVLSGVTYSYDGSILDNKAYGSFSVCNNKKKKLFDIKDYYKHDSDTAYACFFLKAGTSYLKGDCSSPYFVSLNYKSYGRKVASKKKKAVNVKKGKNVSGYFLSGEKGDNCYKLKLTKKHKIKFTFEGNGSDYFYFYIYGKGKNNSTYTYCYDFTRQATYQTLKGGKVPKGTYYIKVTRKSKSASGQYAIKWK